MSALHMRLTVAIWTLAVIGTSVSAGFAQTPSPARAISAPVPTWGIRGFADFTLTTFSAKQSFETITGTSSGTIFGGGGGIVVKDRVGMSVRFGHFSKSGSRAFVFGGQRYGLGIPVRITVKPLMFGIDYQLKVPHIRPYAGFGIGRYEYEETTDFANPGDNVSRSKTAYQITGGARVPLVRWLAVGGEFRWVTVPGALGKGGVSADYGETDLGGLNVALQVLVGR